MSVTNVRCDILLKLLSNVFKFKSSLSYSIIAKNFVILAKLLVSFSRNLPS